MRRFLIVVALVSVATLLIANDQQQWRLSGRLSGAEVLPAAPGTPGSAIPADGATGVIQNPSLLCSATNTTTYTIAFGTNTPPSNIVNGLSLGASCFYQPATLAYSTTYYWRITATNSGGSTVGQIWSFTTQVDSEPGIFVPHPRLLLTSTKLAELIARKTANTAEYAALKSYTDTYIENGCDFANCRKQTTTLTSGLGTGGVGTTFTVVDGSWLPTASHQIRINLELLTVTRSVNTFTVVSRGNAYAATTATVAHAIGANVWYHDPSDFNGLTQSTALLVQMGVTGYDVVARYMLNELATYFGSIYTGDNAIRWYGLHLALGIDWNWTNLSSNDKAAYCTLAALAGDDHIDNPKEGNGYFTRTAQLQAVMAGNNISNGQIRSVLAMAAACGGEVTYPEAQDHWNIEFAKATNYILPAMNGGAIHGGIVVEGSEYMQTDWVQLVDIIQIIESAVGHATIVDSADEWYGRMVIAALYLTVPGTTNSTTTTTGSCSAASTTYTVGSSTSFAVGQDIHVNSGVHLTTIVAIAGTTWTLRDPCPAAYTNVATGHQQKIYAFGDVEQNPNYNDEGLNGGEPQVAIAYAQDRLVVSDPTLAAYAEYWLDNVAPTGLPQYIRWKWFLAHEPNVTAVDYAALPNSFSTDDPDAMGFMVAKSNWTATATAMYLIAGLTSYDHATSYYGSYGYRRKGVYLTRHLVGYGASGMSPPIPFINYPAANGVNEVPYVGAPYHNTVFMNGHGAVSPFLNVSDGEASLARSGVTATYVYGRVDASGLYDYVNWTNTGYANNDADVFVRDWLAIPGSDIMAFHDRLVYRNATTSPTKWFLQTPGNPTVTAQRLSMTHAGQTLIQDVLLPTSAVFAEINHEVDENVYIKGYRTEVTSGVSASTEYGFHVLQGGDSGFSPLAATTLTTTNANVAQVGTTFVVGFVKGTTPTLDITYTLSGTPRNLVCGFAVSTAYHVTRATNTITIAALTGTGDTTSTAAGCLDFTL